MGQGPLRAPRRRLSAEGQILSAIHFSRLWRKVWTNHERKGAQARAFQESREYILPVRFDDTEIPGIRATVGYIDVRSTTPAQLISLVCEKVRGRDNSHDMDGDRPQYQANDVPRTLDEQQGLIETKPQAWEYLLFGGVLIQGRQTLQAKIHNHELHPFPEGPTFRR